MIDRLQTLRAHPLVRLTDHVSDARFSVADTNDECAEEAVLNINCSVKKS